MIIIVDYGMGNLGSTLNMFNYIGVDAKISSDPKIISNAEKLVLPGVGAFGSAMQRINSLPGLRSTLERKALLEKKPILGICLGMQLLTCMSEESDIPGLGWIPGSVYKFPKIDGFKVPHMGWNIAKPLRQNLLTTDLGKESRYYFVHSYYVRVENPQHSIMQTLYGVDFDSAIAMENILGVQFHPEKSHKFGMKLLKNFSQI